jgi:hypothetical protein
MQKIDGRDSDEESNLNNVIESLKIIGKQKQKVEKFFQDLNAKEMMKILKMLMTMFSDHLKQKYIYIYIYIYFTRNGSRNKQE